MKIKAIIFFLLLCTLQSKLSAVIVNYYAKSTGNILTLGNWGTNIDGSGTAPTSFNQIDVRFHFRNRSSFNLFGIGNFILNGTNNSVVIGDGTTLLSFYLPIGYTLKTDSIFFQNNVNCQISGILDCPKPAFDFTSSINYTDTNALQSILPGKYGKLFLTIGSSKKLKGNVQVRNFCSIQNQLLICDTFSLTIGESVAQPGSLSFGNSSNLGAMVVGKIRRWIPAGTISTSQGYFPLGNGIKFLPITINNSSATSGGLVAAEFLPNQTGIYGLPIIDSSYTPFVNINRIDAMGSWRITEESSVSGSNFFVYVKPLNLGNILWEGALRLLKRDLTSGVWGKPGTSSGVCCSAYEPSFGRTGLAYVQGEYCIGSDSNINVLPVLLNSFNGNCENGRIKLAWSTAQEKNTKEFLLEELQENNWSEIGRLPAIGNSQIKQNYSFGFEPKHANQGLQVRLRSIDFDGKIGEPNLLFISCVNESANWQVKPNPFSQEIILSGFGLNQQELIEYELSNQLGELVMRGNVYLSTQGEVKINTAPLMPGAYMIKLKNGMESRYFKTIKTTF